MRDTIHINCDLGEGGGFDDQLMPLISACNIACGGHYGDRESVRDTVALAVRNKVQVGAHPSYPDVENFGRKSMEIGSEELKRTLKEQILRVKDEIEQKEGTLHHVKPHGALYNDIVKDWEKAEIVVESILEIDTRLILFVPPGSIVQKVARGRLKTWMEGFADRGYHADFTLVSRSQPNAVLKTKQEIFERVFSVAKNGIIKTVDQKELKADWDTVCLHSDTENALEILRYLHAELKNNKIYIQG